MDAPNHRYDHRLTLLKQQSSLDNGGCPSRGGPPDLVRPRYLPSGYVKIAIENGPVEIVDFPIKNGDFQ